MYRIILILSCFIGYCFPLQGQQDKVIVNKIILEGHKRTKDNIILRELDFHVGDSILVRDLVSRLKDNERFLLNTGLFLIAKLNVRDWDQQTYKVNISIELKEALYIYPIPIFELADRNFNVWWDQYNHSFARVNYGLRFFYNNVTGRRDLAKVAIQFGYTQKYELEYRLPYINKAQTIGIYGNILFSRNKEIGYNTFNNDLQFYRADDDFLFKRLRIGLGMSYRPKRKTLHRARLFLFQHTISDTVSVLNPDFLLSKQRQRYLSFNYDVELDNRNFRYYPLEGNYLKIATQKRGLGIFNEVNTFSITPQFRQYFNFGKQKKWSTETILKGQVSIITKKPPFYLNKALGYNEDYIRGYEYYVIDGLHFGYLKSGLRYELINRYVNLGKVMPIKSLKTIPVRAYLKLNGDLGYVDDPHYAEGNPLTNDWLWGGGLGFDLVFNIDKVLQLEYSVNRLGEKGLYLHFNLVF